MASIFDFNKDGKIDLNDLNTQVFGLKVWYWLAIGLGLWVYLMPRTKRRRMLGF